MSTTTQCMENVILTTHSAPFLPHAYRVITTISALLGTTSRDHQPDQPQEAHQNRQQSTNHQANSQVHPQYPKATSCYTVPAVPRFSDHHGLLSAYPKLAKQKPSRGPCPRYSARQLGEFSLKKPPHTSSTKTINTPTILLLMGFPHSTNNQSHQKKILINTCPLPLFILFCLSISLTIPILSFCYLPCLLEPFSLPLDLSPAEQLLLCPRQPD